MNKLFISCCLCIAVMAGCDRTEAPSSENPGHGPEEVKSLLIGLIPEQNIFKQMARYEPLAAYLSKKTNTEIKLTVLSRYGNIINNFVSSGMDGAFFGSFTYALAHERIAVQVLARPVNLAGTSTYHGLIFVRRDSGITSSREMKGKRFAFVDKGTTAGYLFPLSYFKKNGIHYKTYLKEGYFTGTHEDAIYDVLDKKADAGAAKNTVYDRLAAVDARIKNQLVILERSSDVPENALAVGKTLDSALKKKLKTALLNMHLEPEGAALLKAFGARQFIETSDEDYLPVFQAAREIELNLATYDYMNE